MLYVQYVGQSPKTFEWSSAGQIYSYRLKKDDVIVIPEDQLGYLFGYGNFFVILENYVGVAITAESKDGVVAEGTSAINDIMVAADGTAHRIKSGGKGIAAAISEAVTEANSTAVQGTTVRAISKLTQAQYDALGTKVSTTLYVIVG